MADKVREFSGALGRVVVMYVDSNEPSNQRFADFFGQPACSYYRAELLNGDGKMIYAADDDCSEQSAVNALYTKWALRNASIDMERAKA